MPSLSATFIGDTHNIDAAYARAGAGAKSAASAIVASMDKTAAALQRQIILAQQEGASYTEAAMALKILNAERAKIHAGLGGANDRGIGMTDARGNPSQVAKDSALADGIARDMSALGQYKARRAAHAKDEAEIARYEEALEAGGQNLGTAGKARPSALLDDPEWDKKFAEAKTRVAARRQLEKEGIDWALTQKAAQGVIWSDQAQAAAAMLKKFEDDRKIAKAAQLTQATIVARGFGAGTSDGSHGKTGLGVVVSEVAVIGHEFLQGRGGGRIIGSISILGQRLGWLRKIIKTTADADVDAARAQGVLSQAASQAAVELEAKAVATEAAATATPFEIATNRLAADAALKHAAAVEMENVALTQKAEISKASAKFIGFGPVGIVAGIVLGIAAGLFAGYKHAKALVDKLSGIKTPDWKPEYIAKYLQKANQALEVQRAINDEIKKQNDLYDSAAEKAQRIAEVTKQHFDHLRKMNDLSNRPDREKERRATEIDAQEREQEYTNKQNEQAALLAESKKKQVAADKILTAVSSKENDQNVVGKSKAMLDAADDAIKILDEHKAGNTITGISSDQVFKAYNALKTANGLTTGISNQDLNAAKKQVRQDRMTYEQSYKAAVNAAHDNDVLRKPGEDAKAAAAESAGKAQSIGDNLPFLRSQINQQNQDAQQELAAKLARSGKTSTDLTANQRIGAFAMPMQTTAIDLARQQVEQQKITNANLNKIINTKTGGELAGERLYNLLNQPFGGGH